MDLLKTLHDLLSTSTAGRPVPVSDTLPKPSEVAAVAAPPVALAATTLSLPGEVEVALHEGVSVAPYLDSRGNWTFGIGHTAAAGGLDPASMSRGTPADVNAALRLAMLTFAEDKAKYEARVRSAVHVPVRPWQFDALFSFDLNTGGIFSARLTQLLNSGAPPSTVADAFFGWLQPPEIKSRRQQEAHLFETGDYRSDDPGVLIPVYTVGPTNHPQLLKQVSYSELIKLVS